MKNLTEYEEFDFLHSQYNDLRNIQKSIEHELKNDPDNQNLKDNLQFVLHDAELIFPIIKKGYIGLITYLEDKHKIRFQYLESGKQEDSKIIKP